MKFFPLFALLLGLTAFSCQGQSNEQTTATASEQTNNTIELIDFYGTHRCMTCNAIEANAKYTVDTYFKDAVAAGTLSFKTVNVDEEANYEIAERFEATGTALFINVIKDGKAHHIDLTDFAFMKGNDREEFAAELSSKLQAELNKL